MHIVTPVARTLSDFDRDLAEEHRLMRLEAMRREVENRDRALFQAHDQACPRCKKRLLSKGLSEPGEFVCLAGRFRARVHRLACPGCRISVYPIDAEIDRTIRILQSAAEHLVLFVARAGGYEKGATEAAFHLGIDVCSSTLHRLVASKGEHVEDRLASEAEEMLATGACPEERVDLAGGALFVAIDGGNLAGSDRASFEIKTAVAWTGTADVSKGRSALTGREGCAALEPADVFFPKVAALSIRNGMLSAGRTVVLAAGADWIRCGVASWLPGALHVLDWTHLERLVREVLRRPEDERVLGSVLQCCRAADPTGALRVLEDWRPPEEDRQRHRRLLRYLRANAHGIANHALVDVHGSGAVEKAVDLIVSRRYKLRGMSWSTKGADALLPFMVLFYNGTWTEHWDSRVASLPRAA